MGAHPNVILAVALEPDGLSRKTLREILHIYKHKENDEINIGEEKYHYIVMEEDYNDTWQISGDEGDIIIFRFITYGYGETVSWNDLEKEKKLLEEWAYENSTEFNYSYKIFVTANHW